MNDPEHLRELEELVQETFTLWDEWRVGFSWRHYYFNHTRRVRALCLTLGRREGADLTKLAFAATLHDLTKRYDGEILTDGQGQRVVDENGFWRNETLRPARRNVVTDLYDAHQLYGQMHHHSGAFLAEILLQQRGFPPDFCADVAAIIRAHVQPQNHSPEQLAALYPTLECDLLHDADMIDANLGYVALYRHVQIVIHRLWEQTGGTDLLAYLDHVPRWVHSKDAFLTRMRTRAGREVAAARQQRNADLCPWIDQERQDLERSRRYGVLGVLDCFIRGHEDPNLTAHLAHLQQVWLPERERELAEAGLEREAEWKYFQRAKELTTVLAKEVAGEE